MSSAVRNGFSTLNRLLGKKNKDSTLSRSTSNLSKSVTNLDASSQHNKIVPLVAASTNAPFEQTFRITICLPRDQLYVARVGAKTKLWQLLEMVCTNKLLDKNKFEFRHPSDSSQVYSNDLTIGEVGLNEIRLSLKTDSHHEPYPKFHTDEIVKLRQNSRESLSSSEFSKNSSRQYTKTTSPYSSTNSLSSMDSTGLNSRHHPPIAPSRKKRIAPRPPSQSSLSERSEVNGDHVFKQPHPVMPPKNFFVSSPNLTNNTDTKGNKHEASDKKIHRIEEQEIEKKPPTPPTSLHGLKKVDVQSNGDNRATYAAPSPTVTPATPTIVDNPAVLSDTSEVRDGPPEPVPRKRTFLAKKKAPSPPPRGLPPVAPPRSVSKIDLTEPLNDTPATPNPNISKVMLNVNNDADREPIPETKEVLVRSTAKSPPPPVTPIISSETTVNSQETEVKHIGNDDDTISQETETDRSTNRTDSSDEDETKVYNIQMGKSLVVETPRKVIEDDEVVENIKNENKEVIKNTNQQEKVNGTESESSLVNKRLDNVRENTPSPRSESPLWSYTLPAPSTFADNKISEIEVDCTDRKAVSEGDLSSEVSDLSDVPIKAVIQRRVPVDFQALDEKSNAESSITSDIEDGYQGDKAPFSRGALLQSLESHRDDFIENEFEFLTKLEDDDKKAVMKADAPLTNGSSNDTDSIPYRKQDVISELNNVIVNNQLETVIRRSETPDDIESAQKSSLSNFIIQTYSNHVDVKTELPAEEKIHQSIESPVVDINKPIVSEEDVNKSDDEIVLRTQTEYVQSKRPSLSNGNLFKSPRVSRSDSFHSTRNGSTENLGLTSRSSSYVSLIGNRSNNTTPRNSITNGLFIDSNRRKSSSELSIADSPSLQSLLVMKTILSNSRKNSLNVDSLSNGSKENGDADDENVGRKSSVELRAKGPVTASSYDDSSKENSPQNKLPSTNDEADSTKWKYQGPPAINLGTWGERPKSMIAIKKDSDYKFGGTLNASDKVDNKTTQTVLKTESPINSPKTVSKPVNVIVETPIENVDVPDNHLPIVRAVVKKVQPANNVPFVESQNIEIRRPSYEVSTIVSEKIKPEPRAPLQARFSWKIPATFNQSTSGANFDRKVPTVRGFKVDKPDAISDKDQSIDSGYKSLSPTVVLINTNKDPPAERPKTLPPPTVAKRPSIVRQEKSEEPIVVPFSQFTLRKTGLKEKIVGIDAANSEPIKQPAIVSPPIQTIQLRQKQEIKNLRPVTIHATTVNQEPIKQAVTINTSIQQTQKQNPQNIHPVAANGTTITKPTIPMSLEPIKRSIVVSSPIQNVQLRPKQEAQTIRPITVHTTVPPPPPPSIVKQVPIVRGVIKQKSLPTAADPRDALLDAIKNFNKSNLKQK